MQAPFYSRTTSIVFLSNREMPRPREVPASRPVFRNPPHGRVADDELSHQNFLNAYLVSQGADPVDMEPFA